MTITSLIRVAAGADKFQAPVRSAICENNSVLAGFQVPWIFRGSMVDLQSGMHGIRWAIARILTQAADRGLTTEEIIDAIRNTNGGDKYPDETIWHNLKQVMEKAGQVVSVQRSNADDADRNSERFIAMREKRNAIRIAHGLKPLSLTVKRPRLSWFLAPEPTE